VSKGQNDLIRVWARSKNVFDQAEMLQTGCRLQEGVGVEGVFQHPTGMEDGVVLSLGTCWGSLDLPFCPI